MTNQILDEYLARVRAELVDLSDTEREAVVDDMRGHLEQAISDRMAADPSADLEAVTLEETRAFGDPAEIAAAHGSTSPASRSSAARRVPRWAWWIVAAIALALVLVVAADVADQVTRPETSTPYDRNNAYVNQTGSVNESFLVPSRAEFLHLRVEVAREGGCLGLRVTDPLGAVVLDEWDTCGAMRHSLTFRPQSTGQFGEWRVELRQRDFTGRLDIQATATLD